MEKMTLVPTRVGRFSALGFVVLAITSLRLFWLPGSEFNAKNWDDEIGWISDSKSKPTLDYILYRDAPGYFVFVPRFLILLGRLNEEIFSVSSLRILVLFVQIVCISFAVSCVVSWSSKWKLWLLLFTTLLLTYIEDLNYIHNVGYLFIFPIYFFTLKRFSDNKSVPISLVFLACLLISKPFTAVLTLSLVLLFLFLSRSLNKSMLLLGAYSLFYILCYLLLPHRWETPFNFDLFTLVKIVVDFPWIVFSTLFPSLYIGAMGVIRILEFSELRLLVGLALNLMAFAITYVFRVKIAESLKSLSLNAKGLVLIFTLNYALAFSGDGSFWVKHFPLYMMDSPQFLWARWSAVLPFTFILIIGSLNNIRDVVKRNIYLFVSAQWIVLIVAGNPWFRRYW